MPLLRKLFGTNEDDPYDWTTGGSRDISHRKYIGSGGYGDVHEIVSNMNGKVFARKLIRLGNVSDQDIKNEAHVVSSMQESGGHENIIRILGHGWLERSVSVYFIDMELCDLSLDEYVRTMNSNESSFDIEQRTSSTFVLVSKNCPLPEKWLNTWTIGSHIAKGLEFMHTRNHVHRDLKPSNILYCRQDNLWKLTDFGITNEATSKRAITTHYSRGTPAYRAPELLSDDPKFTKKVDIWALGCVLYELVTGRKAFHTDHEVVSRRLESQSKLNIPASLLPKAFNSHFDECLHEMLKSDYQQRPPVSVLRGLFESYCLILYPSVPETSDDVENIPPYDTWKEWIKEDIQDRQSVLIDAIKWYKLNRGTESVLRLLEQLLKRWHGKMKNWSVAIEMCEKIVNKTPSEERLCRSLYEERKEWNNALIVAAKRNQADTIALLLDKGAADVFATKDGRTALYEAAAEGHEDIVALLFDKGADIAAQTEYGLTALHGAAEKGHKGVVAMLLDKGADVAATTKDGSTALHKAARRGHKDVVALLLGQGVDAATADNDGRTALHWAEWNGHKEVVALLEKISTITEIAKGHIQQPDIDTRATSMLTVDFPSQLFQNLMEALFVLHQDPTICPDIWSVVKQIEVGYAIPPTNDKYRDIQLNDLNNSWTSVLDDLEGAEEAIWIFYEPIEDSDDLRISLALFMNILCILLRSPVFAVCIIKEIELWWTLVNVTQVNIMGHVLEILSKRDELFECFVCSQRKIRREEVPLFEDCEEKAFRCCWSCLTKHILENKVAQDHQHFPCLHRGCDSRIPVWAIRRCVGEEIFTRMEYQADQEVKDLPEYHNCGKRSKTTCIWCDAQTCFYCKEVWTEEHDGCLVKSLVTDSAAGVQRNPTTRIDLISAHIERASSGQENSTTHSSGESPSMGGVQGASSIRGGGIEGQAEQRLPDDSQESGNNGDGTGRPERENYRDTGFKIKIQEITGIAKLVDQHGWKQRLQLSYCLRVHLHDEDDELCQEHLLTHVEIAGLTVEVRNSEFRGKDCPPQFRIRRTEITVDPLPCTPADEEHCDQWFSHEAYPRMHDYDSTITRATQFSAGAGFTTPHVFSIQGGWQRVTTESFNAFCQAVDIRTSYMNATSKGGFTWRYNISSTHNAFRHYMQLFVRHYNRPCVPKTPPQTLHAINIKAKCILERRRTGLNLQNITRFLGSEKAWGIDISYGQIEVGLRTELAWSETNRSPFPNQNATKRRHVINLTQEFNGTPAQWAKPKDMNLEGEERKGWINICEGKL